MCLIGICAMATFAQTCTVRGTITTEHDGEAACFAIVSIKAQELRTVCDINGHFEFHGVPMGKQVLDVECLGYASAKHTFTASSDMEPIKLELRNSSFALPELHVMAKKSRMGKVLVDEAALEYIQPTSLADVMLLLPGSVYKENNMTQFSQISSRQVGSDANTSLGVGVVTDGAPLSNDGVRTQLLGITSGTSGSYDGEVRSRTGMNQGADMRIISTDHIQSVEFTRGISSARYGNLSSGMISIQSKHGVTPLRIRLKSDLKNSLAYIGKGFRLGEKAGTLHAGMDFLHSIDDIREEMDKFSRLTAQTYYNNKMNIGNHTIDLDARLSQTLTVSKMKKDELTYEYDELYKADYSRTALMLKGSLQMGMKWLDKIEMVIQADYTYDRITRHRMVLSGTGPLNVPLAHEEGEHEGIYLPRKYYSDFYIDNQPLNIYAQLNATTRLSLMRNTMLNFQYGLEYTNVKNHGQGAVIEDETRPPFPYDNSYMRPRPNWAIPALGTGAAYVQADFIYDDKKSNVVALSLGGRLTEMMNLPANYYLHHHVLADPRINLSYTIGNISKHTLRTGYGAESKLPTLDYLYPEKVYKDFYMLNAYTYDPKYRHLITYTNIFDMTNPQLKANRNHKFEVGYDYDARGFSLSLTAFYEMSDLGFEYFRQYIPLTYTLYQQLCEDADITGRIPQKEDYVPEKYTVFTNMSRVENSSKVTKLGVEYRIIFPRIKPLLTTIEVNGAYYKSVYASSQPEFYYPDVKMASSEYPYVCIYDRDARNEFSRFNSNIWLNTHIARHRLFLTNFLQIVWHNASQYKDSHDMTPVRYMSSDGQVRDVDDNIRALIAADNPVIRYFKQTLDPAKYALTKKPVSLLWNIKVTKEFGHGTKLSFFVNKLLDVSPSYVNGTSITKREWNDPYFGFELYLNLQR